ncbi:MAG TPA: hypothetical protein PK843_04975 [bacterium]|nr:hypothetical protein [bacterium]HPN33845.1 hypothetical protein [bacterium]
MMSCRRLYSSFSFLLLIAGLGLAQSGLTVTATSTAAGTPAVYVFSFTADQELSPRAGLAVVFPSGFDLSKMMMADSRSIDGGWLVRVHADTVWAQRSGLGKTITAGTVVDLILAAVVAETIPAAPEWLLLHREESALQTSRQRAEITLRKADRL